MRQIQGEKKRKTGAAGKKGKEGREEEEERKGLSNVVAPSREYSQHETNAGRMGS